MTDRERFLACLLGEQVDRPPYWLWWGPWETTWQRWQKEDMGGQFRNCPNYQEVRECFGVEAAPVSVPVNCGPCPRIEQKILDEDEEYVTWIDGWGIKRRNPKHSTSMSQFLEFPVKGREDWERFKAERLDPHHPERFEGDWQAQCRELMAADQPIQLGNFPDVTVFGGLRWLLGDEECLLAFYTMPDLVHEIMDHLTELYLVVFEKVLAAGVRVDVIHIWEDMSGRQGPLISPKHFDEFMTPNYGRIRDLADRHNVPLMSVDTDGNPDLIIPPMMRGGVNYLWPVEVAAGSDINVFQEKYPTLGLMGGIDKRALAAGPEAIDAELARIEPAVRRGRYIPELDHLIPDDVSWANFCYYAEKLRKLVGKD